MELSAFLTKQTSQNLQANILQGILLSWDSYLALAEMKSLVPLISEKTYNWIQNYTIPIMHIFHTVSLLKFAMWTHS